MSRAKNKNEWDRKMAKFTKKKKITTSNRNGVSCFSLIHFEWHLYWKHFESGRWFSIHWRIWIWQKKKKKKTKTCIMNTYDKRPLISYYLHTLAKLNIGCHIAFPVVQKKVERRKITKNAHRESLSLSLSLSNAGQSSIDAK